MVGIEPESALWFKGSDAPAAMVEVSVYGSASASAYNALTAEVTDVLNLNLGIPSDRIYVMNEGKFVGELKQEEASQESIMACIMRSGRGE